jgi:hypothetical protein
MVKRAFRVVFSFIFIYITSVFAEADIDTTDMKGTGKRQEADSSGSGHKKQDYIYQLPSMVVKDSGNFQNTGSHENSSISFTPENIQNTAGSADDINRFIGTLPCAVGGINGGFYNSLYIRGGRPTEVVYLVDGIELENINHFSESNGSGGPIGFINTDCVRNITLFPGTIPVYYPPRLSSVIDISMKNGSFFDTKGAMGCKLTGGTMQFEGPIVSGKGSYNLAGRYIDFATMRSFIKDAGIPQLGDIFGKIFFMNTDNFDVSASGIFSSSRYIYGYQITDQSDNKETFTNTLNNKQVIVQGGSGISMHYTTAGYTQDAHLSFSLRKGKTLDSLGNFTERYFLDNYAENPIDGNHDNRYHYTFDSKSDLVLTGNNRLIFGTRIQKNTYEFQVSDQSRHSGLYTKCNSDNTPVSDILEIEPSEHTARLGNTEAGIFAADHFEKNALHGAIGIRADYFNLLNAFTVSPQASLNLTLRNAGEINGNIGLYHQFPTEIPSAIFDLLTMNTKIPDDSLEEVEKQLSRHVLPQRCWQSSVGYENTLIEHLHVKTDLYYKWYDQEFKYSDPLHQGAFYFDNMGKPALARQNGLRKATGLELSAGDSHDKRFFYSAGLSYFTVQNSFGDGHWFDDWTNIRYTFDLSIGASFFNSHCLSFSTQCGGGRPYFPEEIQVDCEGRKSVTYDQQNLYGFKRLENLFNASARYAFSKKIHTVELELFIEVLNIFNYQPVLDYQFDGDGFHEIKPFGITPIIGCKLQL